MKKIIGAGILALILTGCGGGGGGTSTPAPSVSLTLSQSKVSLGSSANLTWTSTNATSCTASGAWTGSQSTSGMSAQTPTTSGANTYTLTCTGAGGNGSANATLNVPITVLPSSYENKAAAGESIGAQPLPSEVSGGNAVAFADFFQDGTYSMVTHSLEYNVQDPSTANRFGRIRFYKKVNGTWADTTSQLLTNTTGCLHSRKAVVTDFNGDGKPDVFFACHGFDASPFPGEQPHVLLSQSDGSYKNVTLPVTCYCHSASAADSSGEGYADILVTNNTVAPNVPFFLINNRDGTFTSDISRLPAGVPGESVNGNIYPGQIFTVELIDFNGSGKYDAFLAGTEPNGHFGNWLPTIFKNDGTNHYAVKITLPTDAQFVTTLDIVFKNGIIYLNRVRETYDQNVYGHSAIQKINYTTMSASEIYTNSVSFANGVSWLNWIIPNGSNIVSLDTAYNVSVPQ